MATYYTTHEEELRREEQLAKLRAAKKPAEVQNPLSGRMIALPNGTYCSFEEYWGDIDGYLGRR